MDDAQTRRHAALDFAVHEQRLAFGETVDQETRRAIPNQIEQPAVVAHSRAQHLHAPARHEAALQQDHLADETFFLSQQRGGDLFNLAPVVVAKRQMIKNVFNRAQAGRCQLLGALGPDTL